MHLLLFDIDGTLIQVNGAGRTALSRALSSLTNQPISTDGVTFSGRTDPAIFQAVLSHNDLPTTEYAVQEAIDAYVATMRDSLTSEDVNVLPGVRSLLSTLQARPDVHLGLVTGNVEPIAYEKLARSDLEEYFSVGAFGSDHANRSHLPRLATRRAADHTGHPLRPEEHAVVIGDTAHDIQCARAASARVVAVCTGRYNRDELSQHDPDLLLDSLPEPSTFLRQILDD